MQTQNKAMEIAKETEVTENETLSCAEGIEDDNRSALESALAELEASRREVGRLSSIIDERERAEREAGEFARLFPGIGRDDIPDIVRQSAVERSIPLIAAYALYARERELSEAARECAAKSAALRSSGMVGGTSSEGELYTIDQIRAMSPREVRKNYRAIMKSLNRLNNR